MENKEFVLDQTTIKKLLCVYKLKIPDFQRTFVWKQKKKAQLLESLFRGFPIGAITLYEDQGGYYIIDGLQRINTLNQYLSSPSSVILFKDFFAKVEDDISNLVEENGLSVSMTQIKRCLKSWYDNLGELYEYEKVSVLYKKMKESNPKVFAVLGDLELVEKLMDIVKKAIEIAHDDIALIIYKGAKDDLPDLFKNINTGSVALSQYEILQSMWTDYNLDESIVQTEYQAFIRELELIGDEYEIDAVKEHGNFDIFKNIVGLNHRICCIANGEEIFCSVLKRLNPPKQWEDETKYYYNDTIGFELYSTILSQAPNKIVKAVDDIFAGHSIEEISAFVASLNQIIIDAVEEAVHELARLDYEYFIDSKYHSLYIVTGIILAEYRIDSKNLVIEETDKNRRITKLCLDLRKHNKESWFVDENRQISFVIAKVKELAAMQG